MEFIFRLENDCLVCVCFWDHTESPHRNIDVGNAEQKRKSRRKCYDGGRKRWKNMLNHSRKVLSTRKSSLLPHLQLRRIIVLLPKLENLARYFVSLHEPSLLFTESNYCAIYASFVLDLYFFSSSYSQRRKMCRLFFIFRFTEGHPRFRSSVLRGVQLCVLFKIWNKNAKMF